MVEYYVAFSSITHAMRLEKRIKRNGKRCIIVRTPAQLGVGGCGYSIKTDSEEVGKSIVQEAESFDIRVLGLFRVLDTEVELQT